MDLPTFVKRTPLQNLGPQDRRLLESARIASKKSHSPISGFAVGAALEAKGGKIFWGCNVESEAFSLTSCAEVVACDKAVGEGHTSFERLAIYARDMSGKGRDLHPIPPCGSCRQKLSEFSDMDVLMASEKSKEAWACRLLELLPLPFRL